MKAEFPERSSIPGFDPSTQSRTADRLRLLAPNQFVLDWVQDHFFGLIRDVVSDSANGSAPALILEVGSTKQTVAPTRFSRSVPRPSDSQLQSNLNPAFTFDSFVEGKSNQLARAASVQIAENPGGAYNPLFIYGGVGLGKTHLMHAIGNMILAQNPEAKVVYLHSERFVADMVKALQHNAINDFKRYYRSVDALLIDDIQFFAGKERSQEEFFHTFNALLEGEQQIILTCDRYPKEVNGLEERLKSPLRLGSDGGDRAGGAGNPRRHPDGKASAKSDGTARRCGLFHRQAHPVQYPRAGRRAAPGYRQCALHRTADFTLEFTKEALRDLLALQDKLVTIENIQKTVAEYYKIRVADLLSPRRSRSITRPRQSGHGAGEGTDQSQSARNW